MTTAAVCPVSASRAAIPASSEVSGLLTATARPSTWAMTPRPGADPERGGVRYAVSSAGRVTRIHNAPVPLRVPA